jgi:hypothetical protein
MPLADIRPGMVGVGRTVFTGTRVEEFRATILGVIENAMAPQRSLILARLEGGPLADTGVIAGMSGSPVYIDGKLVGAVAYALGSFSKEPIAGITPIAEMTEAAAMQAVRPPGTRVQVDLPFTRERLVAAFDRALRRNRPFVDRAEDALLVGTTGVPGIGGREIGMMLRPIATPLVMAGFDAAAADRLGADFRSYGFIPAGTPAGTRAGEMPFEGPLKPGDAIGVTFVSGDFLLGGTGTVTHVDGDRVYAFGHPMYNLGPTEFPMTRAYIYTVIPSLFSSSKLAVTGEVIGTLLQDRPTAVAGRLGPGPKLIPVSFTLETDRGPRRTFNFGVVRDQLFTPLMTDSALVNTLVSYERQFGAATFDVNGSVDLGSRGAIRFRNLFSGDSPSSAASAYVVAPLAALMNNDDEAVDIERLDFTIKSSEEPRTATLERVWIDDPRPRAGRTVPLKVLLRTYRGDDEIRTVPIQIPAHANGSVSVMVADGSRLMQIEQRDARRPQQRPRTVTQLVRVLNESRRNNALYVRLLGSEAGAVVGGELLTSLPPSVLAVLEGDRSSGSFSPLQSATLGEWEIETSHAVSGIRTLTVSVSAH